jgi:MYXO-CTERM domain-containing protein
VIARPFAGSSAARSAALAVSSWLTMLLLAAPVAAQSPTASQPAPAASADELTSLEAELDRDEAALATGDCTTACAALGSMRRSVDRICALDPGPRCTAARGKLESATARVRDACSDCGERRENAPGPTVATDAPAAPPPASEPGAGGCAGCTTHPMGAAAPSAFAVAIALAALARRRRRR